MVEKVFFNDEKIEKISERIEHLIKLGKNKSNSESRTSLSKSLSLKPTMFNNKVYNISTPLNGRSFELWP